MVTVEQTDTSVVAVGTGSYQSRSSVSGATSAYRAAKRLREQILNAASYRLDEPMERLGLAGNAITVDGSASDLTLADLAGAEPAVNGGYRLNVLLSYDPPQAAHPYATHVCLVEVDPGTGAVEILRYVVAEDCGNVINPMIVDGQVQGGVAQGIGAALFEEIRYGAEGQLISGSFMDYLLPTAAEIPELKIKHIVTPATMHELLDRGRCKRCRRRVEDVRSLTGASAEPGFRARPHQRRTPERSARFLMSKMSPQVMGPGDAAPASL
jgi:carbon-monoxide dehydrogenase large subunit